MGYIVEKSNGVQHTITLGSSNDKTNNVATVWHTVEGKSALDAANTGADEATCNGCPKRPFLWKKRYERNLEKLQAEGMKKGKATKLAKEKAGARCYVNLIHGAGSVSKSKTHKTVDPSDVGTLLKINKLDVVRFGGYGNPSNMESAKDIIDSLPEGISHLGYISPDQWAKRDDLAGYFQASVDNVKQWKKAQNKGFSTFRLRQLGEPLQEGEKVCPASYEAGKATNCSKCKGCDGKGQSWAIYDHGPGSEVLKIVQRVKRENKGKLVDVDALIKKEIIQAALIKAALPPKFKGLRYEIVKGLIEKETK